MFAPDIAPEPAWLPHWRRATHTTAGATRTALDHFPTLLAATTTARARVRAAQTARDRLADELSQLKEASSTKRASRLLDDLRRSDQERDVLRALLRSHLARAQHADLVRTAPVPPPSEKNAFKSWSEQHLINSPELHPHAAQQLNIEIDNLVQKKMGVADTDVVHGASREALQREIRAWKAIATDAMGGGAGIAISDRVITTQNPLTTRHPNTTQPHPNKNRNQSQSQSQTNIISSAQMQQIEWDLSEAQRAVNEIEHVARSSDWVHTCRDVMQFVSDRQRQRTFADVSLQADAVQDLGLETDYERTQKEVKSLREMFAQVTAAVQHVRASQEVIQAQAQETEATLRHQLERTSQLAVEAREAAKEARSQLEGIANERDAAIRELLAARALQVKRAEEVAVQLEDIFRGLGHQLGGRLTEDLRMAIDRATEVMVGHIRAAASKEDEQQREILGAVREVQRQTVVDLVDAKRTAREAIRQAHGYQRRLAMATYTTAVTRGGGGVGIEPLGDNDQDNDNDNDDLTMKEEEVKRSEEVVTTDLDPHTYASVPPTTVPAGLHAVVTDALRQVMESESVTAWRQHQTDLDKVSRLRAWRDAAPGAETLDHFPTRGLPEATGGLRAREGDHHEDSNVSDDDPATISASSANANAESKLKSKSRRPTGATRPFFERYNPVATTPIEATTTPVVPARYMGGPLSPSSTRGTKHSGPDRNYDGVASPAREAAAATMSAVQALHEELEAWVQETRARAAAAEASKRDHIGRVLREAPLTPSRPSHLPPSDPMLSSSTPTAMPRSALRESGDGVSPSRASPSRLDRTVSFGSPPRSPLRSPSNNNNNVATTLNRSKAGSLAQPTSTPLHVDVAGDDQDEIQAERDASSTTSPPPPGATSSPSSRRSRPRSYSVFSDRSDLSEALNQLRPRQAMATDEMKVKLFTLPDHMSLIRHELRKSVGGEVDSPTTPGGEAGGGKTPRRWLSAGNPSSRLSPTTEAKGSRSTKNKKVRRPRSSSGAHATVWDLEEADRAGSRFFTRTSAQGGQRLSYVPGMAFGDGSRGEIEPSLEGATSRSVTPSPSPSYMRTKSAPGLGSTTP